MDLSGWISQDGVLRMDLSRWGSADGSLKMEFCGWISQDGVLRMDLSRWSSAVFIGRDIVVTRDYAGSTRSTRFGSYDASSDGVISHHLLNYGGISINTLRFNMLKYTRV